MASADANIVGKSLATRGRPHEAMPRAGQLARSPGTTPFPSGHAAAALAASVALEKTRLAAPVILAAAVGASRVACTIRPMCSPGSRSAGLPPQ